MTTERKQKVTNNGSGLHTDNTGAALSDKVVVVTGASGGMGRAHVEESLRLGAHVIMADLVEPAEDLRSSSMTRFVKASVTSETDWQTIMDVAAREYGRIDGLVNNAGLLIPKSMEDTSVDDFDRLVAVNQKGVFLGMRAALPLMEASGGGSIVNISSTAGLVGIGDCFAYSATKFAVRGMSKAAAVELAPRGIRVNSVHPGDTLTPMIEGLGNSAAVPDASFIPLKRFADPREIARMVGFLLTSSASYITGAEIAVDGGYTAA